MSFDYNKIANTAVKLIDNFGQTVTLARTINGVYDPVTGVETTPPTPGNKITKGVLVDFRTDEIDGTKILRTDKKLVIDASVKPLESDLPEFANGEKLGVIKNIVTVNPAGVPIVYFLQVRK